MYLIIYDPFVSLFLSAQTDQGRRTKQYSSHNTVYFAPESFFVITKTKIPDRNSLILGTVVAYC